MVMSASQAAGRMCGRTARRVGSASRTAARSASSLRYSESITATESPHWPAGVITCWFAGSTFVLYR
ncbi:Uncharacterised protein [Mycobacteroides abscessus subsp. abscessus]|nr:Uncharacterised protein [Mycobacteroides abscessus subsp. abscessus]